MKLYFTSARNMVSKYSEHDARIALWAMNIFPELVEIATSHNEDCTSFCLHVRD